MDVETFPNLCGITIRGAAVVTVLVRVFFTDTAPSFAVDQFASVPRGIVVESHAVPATARRVNPLPIATGLVGDGGSVDVYLTVTPDDDGLITLVMWPTRPAQDVATWQPAAWDAWTGAPIACPWPHLGDFNGDGFVNGEDLDLFAALFVQGDPLADVDCDGFVTGADFDEFAAAFE